MPKASLGFQGIIGTSGTTFQPCFLAEFIESVVPSSALYVKLLGGMNTTQERNRKSSGHSAESNSGFHIGAVLSVLSVSLIFL